MTACRSGTRILLPAGVYLTREEAVRAASKILGAMVWKVRVYANKSHLWIVGQTELIPPPLPGPPTPPSSS